MLGGRRRPGLDWRPGGGGPQHGARGIKERTDGDTPPVAWPQKEENGEKIHTEGEQ